MSKILIALAVAGVVVSLYILHLEHEGICLTGHCSSIPAVLGLLWFIAAPLAIKRKKIKAAWCIVWLA